MLTDFFEYIINADSVDELRQSYFDAMAHYGFGRVFYAARFMLAIPASVLHDEIHINSNFPPPFVDRLVSRGALIESPWAQWAMRNEGSVSARGLADQDGGGHAGRAMALAVEQGVQAGQLISLKNKVLRAQGAVFLNPRPGASHDESEQLWSNGHREITALSWVMHMRMATIRRGHALGHLTTRQREVLEWSSAGKTVAEIATILGVAPATIEKHLRLARETLAAGSTAQAILKAHLTNQLFVQNPAEFQDR